MENEQNMQLLIDFVRESSPEILELAATGAWNSALGNFIAGVILLILSIILTIVAIINARVFFNSNNHNKIGKAGNIMLFSSIGAIVFFFCSLGLLSYYPVIINSEAYVVWEIVNGQT